MSLTVPIATGVSAIGMGLVTAYLAVEGMGEGKWYNTSIPAEKVAYLAEQRRNNAVLIGSFAAIAAAAYVCGGKHAGTIGRGVMYAAGGWLAVAVVSTVQDEMKHA